MEIEYYVGEHDLVAFSVYHTNRSPSLRRQQRVAQLIVGLVWLGIGTLQLLSREVFWAAVAFLIGILFIVLWPSLRKRSHRNSATKLYREDSNRSSLGKQRLRIEDDVLVEITEYQETWTKWAGIEKIESTDSYTFIYTGSVMGIVIPKESVTSGDYDEFVDALRSHHELKKA